MPIEVIVCSPGGNITGMVVQPVRPERRAPLARALMRRFPDIEQVGYARPPATSATVATLQMMGGEFCGNATRSLAYLITRGMIPFAAQPPVPARFHLAVSGASRPVACLVSRPAVQIEMPLPEVTPIYHDCGGYATVHLEGISYVVVPRRTGSARAARGILDRCDFRPLRAAGVVYFQRRRTAITMTPYVFVKRTRTLTAETSSASGAVAVAILAAYRGRAGVTRATIMPPSGIPLAAEVHRRGDRITRAFVRGPVRVLGVKRYESA